MRKLMIRYLTISLGLFFLVSCGSNSITKLPKKTVDIPVLENGYFSDPSFDYVYKTNISVYGNDLSGIVIVKKIGELHRVVFTTEFGNKLMDFEISEAEFKINSLVDELNRKILINTLKEDFRLLLRKRFQIQAQYEDVEHQILESSDQKSFNYLFVSRKNKKLHKIVHSSKRKEKFSIIFHSENNIFADKINIQHQNIKLKITLNYLKN